MLTSKLYGLFPVRIIKIRLNLLGGFGKDSRITKGSISPVSLSGAQDRHMLVDWWHDIIAKNSYRPIKSKKPPGMNEILQVRNRIVSRVRAGPPRSH